MKQLAEWAERTAKALDEVNGKTVERTVVRGGRDRDIEDLTERVSRELAKKLRREGLL